MRILRTLRLRARSTARRRRVEDDLDAELRDHLERQVELYRRRGLPEAAARAAARREFGSIALIGEQCRDTRRVGLLVDLRRDARYALHSMRRAPGYTAVAALSLALAIGANSSMFSLVHALLLRDLAVARPHELVELDRQTDGTSGSFSYPFYERLRDGNASFSAVLAMSRSTFAAAAERGGRQPIGRMVSGSFFTTLGIEPAAGRLLTPADDRPNTGDPLVAVIAHQLWQREFGADPAIAGRTLTVAGVPFTIAGVLPPTFSGLIAGRPDDFFIPLASEPRLRRASLLGRRHANWLAIVARLEPGTSVDMARADTALIFARELEDLVANSSGDDAERIRAQRLGVEPARAGLAEPRQQLARPVLLLMGAVGLVLLIACANLVTLLLTRGMARRGELDLRLALGASRSRLVRQLLTESAVLGVVGGVIGVGLARWGTRVIAAFLADGDPALAFDIAPGGRVLAFTAALSLGSALLAGIVPALRAARAGAAPAARDQTRTQTAGRGYRYWTRGLIAAQVALSLLLLTGASLLITSLRNLRGFDAGFDRQVLLVGLNPGGGGLNGERRREYYREVLERARAVPGVRAAGLSLLAPVSGGGVDMSLGLDGQPPRPGAIVYVNEVSDGYFAAMRTRLLLGRDFGRQDTAGSTPVGVINEVLARRYFGDLSPIGRRISVGNRGQVEIVGMVANAKYLSLREADHPTVYVHALQNREDLWGLTLAVGTSLDPGSVAPALWRDVQALAPAAPVGVAVTLASRIERTLVTERLMTRILSAFAALAVLLAATGLYGVLAYTVTRRTTEIGVRLALGAERHAVLWPVLREAGMLVAIGVVVGLPAALLLTRLLVTLLYGVTPADPRLLGAVVVGLFTVAVAAGLPPAWRAARVDPLVALRHE